MTNQIVEVHYAGAVIPLPAGTTAAQAKEVLSMSYPEIENASVSEEVVDGVTQITFTVKSGTKGSDAVEVHYAGGVIPLPAGTTAEQAKEVLSMSYPEIENASVSEEVVDGVTRITFTVKSGTKGSDAVEVHYAGGVIPLPAGTTAEQAKEVLAMSYPEIENASVSEEVVDGVTRITFTVKSGTKGF